MIFSPDAILGFSRYDGLFEREGLSGASPGHQDPILPATSLEEFKESNSRAKMQNKVSF
jgi:hypothetical protein